jgi:hypothetical protein
MPSAVLQAEKNAGECQVTRTSKIAVSLRPWRALLLAFARRMAFHLGIYLLICAGTVLLGYGLSVWGGYSLLADRTLPMHVAIVGVIFMLFNILFIYQITIIASQHLFLESVPLGFTRRQVIIALLVEVLVFCVLLLALYVVLLVIGINAATAFVYGAHVPKWYTFTASFGNIAGIAEIGSLYLAAASMGLVASLGLLRRSRLLFMLLVVVTVLVACLVLTYGGSKFMPLMMSKPIKLVIEMLILCVRGVVVYIAIARRMSLEL